MARAKKMVRRRGSATKAKRQWKTKVKRVVKSQALRDQETKFSVTYDTPLQQGLNLPNGTSGAAVNAGTVKYFPVTDQISPSVNEAGARIGNEITLKGCTVKFAFTPLSNFDATQVRDVAVRILLLKITPDSIGTTGTANVNLGQLFHIPSVSAVTCNPTTFFRLSDKDQNGIIEKCYYDRVHKLSWGNYQNTGASGTNQANFSVINKSIHQDFHNLKFQFAGPTSLNYGSKFDLIWVIIPWHQAVPLGTAGVANMRFAHKLWYKDG